MLPKGFATLREDVETDWRCAGLTILQHSTKSLLAKYHFIYQLGNRVCILSAFVLESTVPFCWRLYCGPCQFEYPGNMMKSTSRPSILLRCAAVLVAAAVIAGCGGAGGGDDSSASSSLGITPAATQLAQNTTPQINVDLSSLQFTSLKQGLVDGLGGYSGPNATWDTANGYISALKPQSWRFSALTIYNFVVRDYQYDGRFNTSIVINLQDIFNTQYGKPITVSASCSAGQTNCFTSFDALRQTWVSTLQQVLIGTSTLHVNYFDLLAEPDIGSFVNVSPDQIYLLLKDAYGLVKTYRPDAKIVAPSISGFNATVFQNLFAYLVTDNLHLDAISWHELGDDPDVIPGHVATVKSLFSMYPQLCSPACPEIHINEYQGANTMFIPGYAVGWLRQLEAAKIDQANRACWSPGDAPSISYETCWYGFEGMLTPDNFSPQALYWIYKYYADLNGARYPIQNSVSKVAAIAGPLGAGQIGLLLGNYGTASATFQVKLNHFQSSSARIDLYRLQNNLDQAAALPQVNLYKSTTVRASNSTAVVDGSISAGDAYWAVVTPL